MENHKNYNCRATTDNDEEFLLYANWLHNEHLDQWQGWICEAGATRLLIDKELQVYGGECKNDYLGSALTEFSLLPNTVCQQPRCNGCTDDLIVTKYKP